MDRDFEKFRGGPTQPPQGHLYVSITRQNMIGMNAFCYRELGKPPAVNLYFSRARDIIMIEPVPSANLPEAFPVRQKTHSGYRINASPFCQHFNIRMDTTQRFAHPEIRDGKLILKLGETVTTRHIRRQKKKSE